MSDVNVRAVITADDRASKALQDIGNNLKGIETVAGSMVTFRGLGDVVKDTIAAFTEGQNVAGQLGAVLQSTGGIAGVTSQQADTLANSLQQITTFSHETVGSAENMLLTFTNIGRSIFPETTKATLDLAQAMGIDTRDAAIEVGKALNDPILGTQNLRRVGVEFNQTTMETIKNLVESGKGMQAQKMILAELTREFGGSAQAAGATFGGQLKILSNNINDTKERMGEILADGIAPFIGGINSFIQQNGQLIASLGIAGLAAGGFAAAVIGTISAISLAVMVMGGPLTIVLGIVAALFGTVVFNAMQKFQDKMKQTNDNFGKDSKTMAADGANNFGAVNKSASDLADKLADIDDQMTKTTRDFRQSLAQMVSDHQQKVVDITKQLDDENKAFTDAQELKNIDFKSSNDKIVSDHQQKTGEIESLINQELIAGTNANAKRINDLRVRLAQENEAYNKQVSDNQLKYDDDKNKAIASHEAKTTSFQKNLDAETALLAKHGAEITSIQGVQLLDQIDKLKQSNADQMVQYKKQKDDAIKNAGATTAGMAGEYNKLPSLVNGSAFSGLGTQLGKDMGKALENSFFEAWGDMVNGISKAVGGWASGAGAATGGAIKGGVSSVATFIDSLTKLQHIPGFAEGGTVPGATGAPTLAVVHGGEQVIPVGGGGGGGNVNVTLNGVFMGTPADGRRLAEMVKGHLQDIAGSKNMSAAEYLS